MRVRSTYFKVRDMEAEVELWRTLLQAEPVKLGSHWSEFLIDGVRLGLLLNDFGEELRGSSAVPVLEFELQELQEAIDRAKNAGAGVVLDGLANPKVNAMLLASPGGHAFELCNCAAH